MRYIVTRYITIHATCMDLNMPRHLSNSLLAGKGEDAALVLLLKWQINILSVWVCMTWLRLNRPPSLHHLPCVQHQADMFSFFFLFQIKQRWTTISNLFPVQWRVGIAVANVGFASVNVVASELNSRRGAGWEKSKIMHWLFCLQCELNYKVGLQKRTLSPLTKSCTCTEVLSIITGGKFCLCIGSCPFQLSINTYIQLNQK